MAQAVGKSLCVRCRKDKAAYKCEGCSQHFCFNHLADHHQSIGKQLDEIEDKRNNFREILTEQKTNSQKHSLVRQINQWEQNSIEKIQQIATKARQSLSDCLNKHIYDIEMRFNKFTQQLKEIRQENDFNEIIINQLKENLIELEQELSQPSNISIRKDSSPFIGQIYVVIPTPTSQLYVPNISTNARWVQNGITVAGGNGPGDRLNQLYCPWGLYVDDNQTVYVSDYFNHRIVQWQNGANAGQVVAGGNGSGNRPDQLNYPANIIVDRTNDSLIICEYGNRRVVRWPRQNGTKGEIIISDIGCWGLAMDSNGYLYVSDINQHEIRRWKIGETDGTLVAGGNGQGNRLDQLNDPRFIFVDQDQSVYVSDSNNHRVIKWMKNAKEGIIVAGGLGQGNSLSHLSCPHGIIVDQQSTTYTVDHGNHRIVRWSKRAREASVLVGANIKEGQANQLHYPTGLSFDRQNNLYVVDNSNYRVQKFNIER